MLRVVCVESCGCEQELTAPVMSHLFFLLIWSRWVCLELGLSLAKTMRSGCGDIWSKESSVELVDPFGVFCVSLGPSEKTSRDQMVSSLLVLGSVSRNPLGPTKSRDNLGSLMLWCLLLLLYCC